MQHRILSDRTASAIRPARRLGVDAIGPYQYNRPAPPSRLLLHGSCSTGVSS
ncbi:hypothetical protein ABZ379_49160 [Streptomyces canus]|uniref:hypothetical protein n=1 Tax=Streptomyces canus TaxID=58343 RepID=UPI0033FEEEBF